MKMRLGVLTVVLLLVLAGCAQTRISSTQTRDQIDRDVAEAVASGPKQKAGDAVERAMMPPLSLDGTVPAQQTEPVRFDLVVNEAPAAQVFLAIVSGTRFSILVPPEINGRLTLNLKNVSLREALDTIRDLYGYGYSVKGARIFIQPNTLQTRIFKINYLAGRRIGSSDVRVMSSSMSSSATQGQTPSVGGQAVPMPGSSSTPGSSVSRNEERSQVRTMTDQDFWKDLSAALSTIIGDSQGAQVVVNAGSGVILVRALPSEMKIIEEYLRATQAIVERQVMLEAKIIRVTLSERFQSGVNWLAFNGSSNRWSAGNMQPGYTLQGDGKLANNDVTAYPGRYLEGVYGGAQTAALGKGFFGLAFQSATFAALMSFLETQGDTHVLSSPRLATLNNQKAVLKVGKDEFYVTNLSATQTTTASGSAGASIPNVTLQPFFSGVSLDVTPQIDDDGSIILHIHPSITKVEEVNKTLVVPNNSGSGSSPVSIPTASSYVNESDTVVRVADGQIVAIGGLMDQIQQKDSDGLAGAVSTPGVGALFGQKSTGFAKTELVILLKPTVIQGDSAWREDLLETQQRLKNFDPRQNKNSTQE